VLPEKMTHSALDYEQDFLHPLIDFLMEIEPKLLLGSAQYTEFFFGYISQFYSKKKNLL
jgi:hypothetical protein